MRCIYIRHTDKDFKNGNAPIFKHDPGITEIGVEKAKIIAKRLIEEYGEPQRIVCSPFRRARETALIMNMACSSPLEEIEVDPSLSEYLGNHNDSPLDVTMATQIHKPPHPENFEDMKTRVKKHMEKNKKEINFEEEGVIWFITHGIIIKQISALFGIKTSKQIPYLTCFSFLEQRGLLHAEFLLFSETPSFKYYPRYDKNLIDPQKDYTGRDDISGRLKSFLLESTS